MLCDTAGQLIAIVCNIISEPADSAYGGGGHAPRLHQLRVAF